MRSRPQKNSYFGVTLLTERHGTDREIPTQREEEEDKDGADEEDVDERTEEEVGEATREEAAGREGGDGGVIGEERQ